MHRPANGQHIVLEKFCKFGQSGKWAGRKGGVHCPKSKGMALIPNHMEWIFKNSLTQKLKDRENKKNFCTNVRCKF